MHPPVLTAALYSLGPHTEGSVGLEKVYNISFRCIHIHIQKDEGSRFWAQIEACAHCPYKVKWDVLGLIITHLNLWVKCVNLKVWQSKCAALMKWVHAACCKEICSLAHTVWDMCMCDSCGHQTPEEHWGHTAGWAQPTWSLMLSASIDADRHWVKMQPNSPSKQMETLTKSFCEPLGSEDCCMQLWQWIGSCQAAILAWVTEMEAYKVKVTFAASLISVSPSGASVVDWSAQIGWKIHQGDVVCHCWCLRATVHSTAGLWQRVGWGVVQPPC